MIYALIIIAISLLISFFTRAKFFEVTTALFLVWFAIILLVKIVQLIKETISKSNKSTTITSAAGVVSESGSTEKRMKRLPYGLITIPVTTFSYFHLHNMYQRLSGIEISFHNSDFEHIFERILIYLVIHMAVLFVPVIRRLNDAGKSRLFGWLTFVPFINLLLILPLLILPSKNDSPEGEKATTEDAHTAETPNQAL